MSADNRPSRLSDAMWAAKMSLATVVIINLINGGCDRLFGLLLEPTDGRDQTPTPSLNTRLPNPDLSTPTPVTSINTGLPTPTPWIVDYSTRTP